MWQLGHDIFIYITKLYISICLECIWISTHSKKFFRKLRTTGFRILLNFCQKPDYKSAKFFKIFWSTIHTVVPLLALVELGPMILIVWATDTHNFPQGYNLLALIASFNQSYQIPKVSSLLSYNMIPGVPKTSVGSPALKCDYSVKIISKAPFNLSLWTDKNRHVCQAWSWSRVVDCLKTVSWWSHDCLMNV